MFGCGPLKSGVGVKVGMPVGCEPKIGGNGPIIGDIIAPGCGMRGIGVGKITPKGVKDGVSDDAIVDVGDEVGVEVAVEVAVVVGVSVTLGNSVVVGGDNILCGYNNG